MYGRVEDDGVGAAWSLKDCVRDRGGPGWRAVGGGDRDWPGGERTCLSGEALPEDAAVVLDVLDLPQNLLPDGLTRAFASPSLPGLVAVEASPKANTVTVASTKTVGLSSPSSISTTLSSLSTTLHSLWCAINVVSTLLNSFIRVRNWSNVMATLKLSSTSGCSFRFAILPFPCPFWSGCSRTTMSAGVRCISRERSVRSASETSVDAR